MKSGDSYYAPSVFGVADRISLSFRTRICRSILDRARPNADTRVLDVGVTSDQRRVSNVFERLYPYPDRLTAVGLDDASFLEEEVPGLRFVKADALKLPFPDKSFDLVVSFAVIEHVGDWERQRAFVNELCRVGRSCCITTPSRWFPLEFHSMLPLVHWLPAPQFRTLLKFLGKSFLAEEENLNLLSSGQMKRLFPQEFDISEMHIRFLGLKSNLVFYLDGSRHAKIRRQESADG